MFAGSNSAKFDPTEDSVKQGEPTPVGTWCSATTTRASQSGAQRLLIDDDM